MVPAISTLNSSGTYVHYVLESRLAKSQSQSHMVIKLCFTDKDNYKHFRNLQHHHREESGMGFLLAVPSAAAAWHLLHLKATGSTIANQHQWHHCTVIQLLTYPFIEQSWKKVPGERKPGCESFPGSLSHAAVTKRDWGLSQHCIL